MVARVVVGIDGSEHARRALRFAVAEVRRRRDAVLVVAMAYPPPMAYAAMDAVVFSMDVDPEGLARAEVDRALSDVPDDVVVETVLAEGSPAKLLLDLSHEATLVVVGSRGRGGVRSLLLGSTSHRVVSHAHCPVVVVPSATPDTSSVPVEAVERSTSSSAAS